MSNRIIVTQFITLDGVVEDPDGSQGTVAGGWAFRYGAGPVTEDKFRLGSILDDGVLLFGRRTWEAFALRWPARTGAFATTMNTITKVVASRTLEHVETWSNSRLLAGEVLPAVRHLRAEHDVVVVGSTSLVHQLAAARMVDEYRLLMFPAVLGTGERLFAAGPPADLELISADVVEPAVLLCYRTTPR